MRQASRAHALAVANQMPRPDPVIRTILPASLRSMQRLPQTPSNCRAGLRRALPGESNALDLEAIAVAELQSAGRAHRRIGREELAPDPVHLVVIRGVG